MQHGIYSKFLIDRNLSNTSLDIKQGGKNNKSNCDANTRQETQPHLGWSYITFLVGPGPSNSSRQAGLSSSSRSIRSIRFLPLSLAPMAAAPSPPPPAAFLPPHPRIVNYISTRQGAFELAAQAAAHPGTSVIVVVTGSNPLQDARKLFDGLVARRDALGWCVLGLDKFSQLLERYDVLCDDRNKLRELVGSIYADMLIGGSSAPEVALESHDAADDVQGRVRRLLSIADGADAATLSLTLLDDADEARRLCRAGFLQGRRDLAALKQLVEDFWIPSINRQLEGPAFVDGVHLPEEIVDDLLNQRRLHPPSQEEAED